MFLKNINFSYKQLFFIYIFLQSTCLSTSFFESIGSNEKMMEVLPLYKQTAEDFSYVTFDLTTKTEYRSDFFSDYRRTLYEHRFDTLSGKWKSEDLRKYMDVLGPLLDKNITYNGYKVGLLSGLLSEFFKSDQYLSPFVQSCFIVATSFLLQWKNNRNIGQMKWYDYCTLRPQGNRFNIACMPTFSDTAWLSLVSIVTFLISKSILGSVKDFTQEKILINEDNFTCI